MVFGCSIFAILANKIGLKNVLIIGTLGYAPYSASMYVNNRYGVEWFVLFGGATWPCSKTSRGGSRSVVFWKNRESVGYVWGHSARHGFVRF